MVRWQEISSRDIQSAHKYVGKCIIHLDLCCNHVFCATLQLLDIKEQPIGGSSREAKRRKKQAGLSYVILSIFSPCFSFLFLLLPLSHVSFVLFLVFLFSFYLPRTRGCGTHFPPTYFLKLPTWTNLRIVLIHICCRNVFMLFCVCTDTFAIHLHYGI